MTETWQIPILTEAVRFLFDVGRFALNEIKSQRAQRKTHPSSSEVANADHKTAASVSDAQALVISSEEEALKTQVEESRVKQKETEIQHFLKLVEIYNTNYHLAQEKYARWGNTLVPPVIIHELEDAEEHLLETIEKLKIATETVLGKRIDYQA